MTGPAFVGLDAFPAQARSSSNWRYGWQKKRISVWSTSSPSSQPGRSGHSATGACATQLVHTPRALLAWNADRHKEEGYCIRLPICLQHGTVTLNRSALPGITAAGTPT